MACFLINYSNLFTVGYLVLKIWFFRSFFSSNLNCARILHWISATIFVLFCIIKHRVTEERRFINFETVFSIQPGEWVGEVKILPKLSAVVLWHWFRLQRSHKTAQENRTFLVFY